MTTVTRAWESEPAWRPETERWHGGHALRVYEPFATRIDAPRPVLVMLHGLGENGSVWLEVCRLLSLQFRTFCLELPWSGQNGQGWGHIQPAPDWLRQALAMVPASPTLLVGHSLGANAILEYLHAHGTHEVKGVVLVSPFYRSHYGEFTWAQFDNSREVFWKIMAEGLQVRQGSRIVEPSLVSAVAEKVHEFIGPLGFVEFLSLFMRTPALKLDRIQTPVLVVGGERDPGSTPASNTALAPALPRGRLALIPDGGHFCMLSHPQVVGQLMDRFLSDCLEAGQAISKR